MEYDDGPAVSEHAKYDYYNGSITAEDYDYEYYHVYPMTFFSVVQGTGAAVGLLANTLLLVLLGTTPRQRTVSYMFLRQRAVAEVIDLVPMVLFSVIRESSKLKMTAVMCSTLSVVLHVGTVADLVFLMLFALDSYLASRPQHHTPAYRHKVMGLTSAAAWLLAAALGVVAYFSTFTTDNGKCLVGPFHKAFSLDIRTLLEVSVLLVVPLVVVWVFVSMALPPRPAALKLEEGHEGPNRRLLLGLASTFTVLHGVYHLVKGLSHVLPLLGRPFFYIEAIAYSLPIYSEAINPILVICLTEGLRQKVTGLLPTRHSDSLPLREL